MSFVVGVDKKGTFSNCRDWSPEEHKGSCERGEREAVETDSCSRLSSGPQRSTPCARTCEYGSSCGERDFAEVNKDLEMGERRDRPEQRPHTRKTRSPGNGAWFWKAEALRMGSDFQDERRLLRTPKKGQMCPARPRHVTKAERLGDGGLVRPRHLLPLSTSCPPRMPSDPPCARGQ
ncbi:uncharacterized protein LOC118609963 isoform X5 [Rousettus aegyptiacus]|uniref:uncharacterized protein LOC118609963 isoform X5 n=1 Tax=Rousettus aegyptiacus TaxID=9407 RepID=UPI00168CC344|nr:uncharacterized protein LOC118609963 isoform X5 [Rousettus aegyptiacus]